MTKLTPRQRLKEIAASEQEVEEVKFSSRIDRVRRKREQELAFLVKEQEKQIEMLKAEAESAVQRFTAASGNFSEALLALSNNETLVKVSQAWDIQRTIADETLAGTLKKMFDGTPLRALVSKLAENAGQ